MGVLAIRKQYWTIKMSSHNIMGIALVIAVVAAVLCGILS
jgi:hypothetical protein